MNILSRKIQVKLLFKKIKNDLSCYCLPFLEPHLNEFINVANENEIHRLQEYLIKSNNPLACIIFANEYPNADLKRIEEIVIKYGKAPQLIAYLENFNVVYNVYSISQIALELEDPDLCIALLKTDLNLPRRELLKIVYKMGTDEQIYNCMYLKNISTDEVFDTLLLKEIYFYIHKFLQSHPETRYLKKFETALLYKVECNPNTPTLYYENSYIDVLINYKNLSKCEILKKITLEHLAPKLNLAFATRFKSELTNEDIDKILPTIVDYGNTKTINCFMSICQSKLSFEQRVLLEFAYTIQKNNENPSCIINNQEKDYEKL